MLLLSRPFKVEKVQNEKLALEFCSEIGKLITSRKYSNEVIVATVNSILDGLSGKQNLREAIEKELLRCFPDLKWVFKSQNKQKSQLEQIIS